MSNRSLLLLLLLTVTNCIRRPVSTAVPSEIGQASYVDLQPGWRLRAIVPLWKSAASGSQAGEVVASSSLDHSMTVRASTDFAGYETQYYALRRNHGGVRIRFDSATATRNGGAFTEEHPTIELFRLPSNARYVRLVYLLRESQSDHNMAVVGANSRELLAAQTRLIEADAAACRVSPDSSCSWIPAGIAVRPERSQRVLGVIEWVPAP